MTTYRTTTFDGWFKTREDAQQFIDQNYDFEYTPIDIVERQKGTHRFGIVWGHTYER